MAQWNKIYQALAIQMILVSGINSKLVSGFVDNKKNRPLPALSLNMFR